MAQYLYAANVAPGGEGSDFVTHHLGPLFKLGSAREAIGGRAPVPTTGRPSVYFWQLWRVADMLKLAEVNLNDPAFPTPTPGAWMAFDSSFFTPTPGNIALSADPALYIVNTFSGGPAGGSFVYLAPFAYPYINGVATILEARFETGLAQNVMPSRQDLGEALFADVLLEVPGMSSVPGTHSASGTATSLTASGVADSLTTGGTTTALSATGTP